MDETNMEHNNLNTGNMDNKNMNTEKVAYGYDEFEEMKAQVSLLHKKLDNESMLNDKLMRQVMKGKVGSINTYITKIICLGLLAIVLMYFDFAILFPLSVTFLVCTELMLVGALSFTVWNKILLGSVNMMEDNLLDVCRKLVRFKRREIHYLYVSVPVLVLWLGWIMYEFYVRIDDPDMAYALSISCGIGALVGFCIGIYMFRRMIRNINDVIEQIEMP